MKHYSADGKNHHSHSSSQKSPKTLIFFILSALLLLTLIPIYSPFLSRSSSNSINQSENHPNRNRNNEVVNPPADLIKVSDNKKCDVFTGEWVPNLEAPYYTNTSCWAIHEHQNCMKYGRPDSEFMKWKWKPDGCDLPLFNPYQFLEIVRDKSMAFVGDSVGRNGMQSLICMLSRVEYPIDVSDTPDENFKRWKYTTFNFTMSTFWTPFLVKSEMADANGPTHTGLFNLYLDEFDEAWTSKVAEFDYVIINAGHWFTRTAVYYENRQIVGCRFCELPNVTDLPMSYGYKKAFRTAFRALNSLEDYKGTVYLRTFAPMHFENGEWNEGGDCLRTKPFKSDEIKLEGNNLEFYLTQMEEFRMAERKGRDKGLKFRLMDVTQAMLLRPDGHPSKYGHWPGANVTLYNDCVHWCLPGPIDTWSDFLLHLLKMEGRRSVEDKLYLATKNQRV